MNQIDFLATFAALLGQEIPAGQAGDSRNMLKALLGEDKSGLPWMLEEADTLALREGAWKFILRPKQKDGDELYDLAKDPAEQNNVRAANAERAAAMKAKLLAARDAKDGVRALK